MMTATSDKTATILAVSNAHRVLLAAASALFRTCEDICKNDADTDFDATAAGIVGDLEQLGDSLNQRLKNEWSAFQNSLRVAASNCRYDVPRRQGVDEKNHVRTFNLNCAGSAFTRLRNAAREHLIAQIEG
jgi:hypothetical protein